MITCYNSITFWGNPEKHWNPSTFSVKISRIVGALSNFSERPPLAGLDRISSSSWKNINYITYCIFWFGVFFLILKLTSLEDCLHATTLWYTNMPHQPPLCSPTDRGTCTFTALFSSCKQIRWSRPAWKLLTCYVKSRRKGKINELKLTPRGTDMMTFPVPRGSNQIISQHFFSQQCWPYR